MRGISNKIAPLVYGSGLIGHCFIYFKGSDAVSYESGFSRYGDFYGTIFKVEGYDANAFLGAILQAPGAETLWTGVKVQFAGQALPASLVIWPLGYGQNRRGAVVSLFDANALSRVLEGFPSAYGGRGCVLDRSGEVISYYGSGDIPDAELALKPGDDAAVRTIRANSKVYRVYRMASPSTGWTFAAALDEAGVLSGARRVRDIAVTLLSMAILLGAVSVFALAIAQAKPVGRIFSLALDSSPPSGSGREPFKLAEDAILALRDSRDKYQSRAIAAEDAARANFLRRLLDGAFREHEPLSSEAAASGVLLGQSGLLVFLCRIANASGLAEGSLDGFQRVLERSAPGILAQGEYMVPLGSEEFAFILEAGASMRAEATRLADALMSLAAESLRDSLAFSSGEPVNDPRLLQASLLQAKAASPRAKPGVAETVFYGDLPQAPGGLRYPIDVEESIMKAVRSANLLLLKSLLASIVKANLDEGLLQPQEAGEMATALRVTASRLLPEFQAEARSLMERLRLDGALADPRESMGRTSALLCDMAELAARYKRSRNRELASSVRSFIEKHYSSQALGLPMIAAAHRLSENYLSNLYKEQEGECVSDTIEKARIAAACALLEEDGRGIDAIAAACGYSSGVTFRRAFKRTAGLSPSDYRNRRESRREGE
jgi:AraC-like DNA-binding protein